MAVKPDLVDLWRSIEDRLGPPERLDLRDVGHAFGYGTHPVFSLASHHRSDDGAAPRTGRVAANPYRGDHMSIPLYDETGAVGAIEVSFHKGDLIVELIGFPHAGSTLRDMAVAFLQAQETR